MMIQNNTLPMRKTFRRAQQINSCNIHLNSSRNLSRFPVRPRERVTTREKKNAQRKVDERAE